MHLTDLLLSIFTVEKSTQLAFPCSKLTMETPAQSVKSVQGKP